MNRVFCSLVALLTAATWLQGQTESLSNLFMAARSGDKSALQKLTVLGGKGNAGAQDLLGLLYNDGEGVPKDSSAAAEWFQRAAEAYRPIAEHGDTNAQFTLGRMYAHGQGVPKDAVLAARWYRSAAEQGDAAAMHNLAQLYFAGDGVPKDFVSAYMWFNLAAAKSSYGSREERDTLEKRMTPVQIEEAQRLSREWKPETQTP